jgi:hypothetical protein
MLNAYKILVRKPEGKRPLRRPMHRWEDNIRMGLREIEWEGVDRMHLVQDRGQWWALVNTAKNIWVPVGARNLLTSWVTISFLRMTLLHVVSLPKF